MSKREVQQGFGFALPPPMPSHCVVKASKLLVPTDPNADQRDAPRLSGQNQTVLALLQSKPEVTNTELASISMKYTSRLSDVRAYLDKTGSKLTINARRGHDGLWFYSLGEAE